MQEIRRELAQVRDRVNYLLDRLDISDGHDVQSSTPGGPREDVQTGIQCGFRGLGRVK